MKFSGIWLNNLKFVGHSWSNLFHLRNKLTSKFSIVRTLPPGGSPAPSYANGHMNTNYRSECSLYWPVPLQLMELLFNLEPSYSTHFPATSLNVQLAGVSARTVDTSSAGSKTNSMITRRNGQACYSVQNFGSAWFNSKNAHHHSFQNFCHSFYCVWV